MLKKLGLAFCEVQKSAEECEKKEVDGQRCTVGEATAESRLALDAEPPPPVFFVRVANKGLMRDAASRVVDTGFETVVFSGSFEFVVGLAHAFLNREIAEGTEKTRGKGEEGEFSWASIENGSMEFKYCQVSNSTERDRFELRQNKWSGWRRLAGNWEFGETVGEY
jgi:hypothetical protein